MKDYVATSSAFSSPKLAVVEFGRHQAMLGERKRYAARVYGNPAAAPLLSDIGRRTTAAGRVEHQVARVGGHQHAALDTTFRRFVWTT